MEYINHIPYTWSRYPNFVFTTLASSIAMWEENDPGVLTSRHHYHIHVWMLVDRIKLYVVITGLQVSRLGTMTIDHALGTILVEQSLQKIHTFHLPVGEATIMVKDVVILLGL